MTVTALSRQDIIDISHETTLYEWTVQSAMKPMVIERAKGIYLWDADGKRYMDFNSQLMCTNIGHGDERVNNAIKAQLDTVAYVAPTAATTAARAEAGQLLAEITPKNLTKAFFTNGGAEANENAIKIARRTRSRSPVGTPAATKSWRAIAPTTAPPPARSRSPATRGAGLPSQPSPALCASPTSTPIAPARIWTTPNTPTRS
jgi:hypothetical protein